MKVLAGLDLQGQRITQLGDPSSGTDAANKQYVDNVARGLFWKEPVRAAATANINTASPGATFDGVALATGNRVLLMNQSTASQNGIYVWNGAAVAMTRAADADTGTELAPGTAVTVTEGATYGDKSYLITSDTAITIGTTAMTWGLLGGGQTYTGQNGVNVSGSVISGVAAASGGLITNASGFSVDTAIVTRKLSGNLGNGSLTTIAVVHNLGTKDVQVGLREVATDAMVMTDWVATDINTVTFTFAVAPASNALRWTIQG